MDIPITTTTNTVPSGNCPRVQYCWKPTPNFRVDGFKHKTCFSINSRVNGDKRCPTTMAKPTGFLPVRTKNKVRIAKATTPGETKRTDHPKDHPKDRPKDRPNFVRKIRKILTTSKVETAVMAVAAVRPRGRPLNRKTTRIPLK